MRAKTLKMSKRTRSYVRKILGEFENLVMLGYTHENFNNISRALGRIGDHLFLDEVQRLQELWRDSYTDGCDRTELQLAVAEIRDRF